MVPEGWKKAPLKALLEGHSPGYWGSRADGNGAGVPVLRSTNFRDDGFLDLSDVAYRDVPREKIEQKRLRKGDLLLESSGGGPNKPVGRVVMVDGDLDGDFLYTNFLRRLRPREDQADARFLLYLLWNLHRTGGTKVFQHQTTGIRNLNYKEYLRWEHSIPPLLEQRKIAAILYSVDDTIAATRRAIEQTRRVKQGLLQTLMTRGIGHTRFKRTEIGEIPEAWDLVPLESLLAGSRDAMRSGPFGSALLKSELVAEGIPLLGIDNIHEEKFRPSYSRFVSPEKYEELQRYAVRPRDVVITIMGTVGRTCVLPPDIGPALSSKHLWTMTFNTERCMPELVSLQLNWAPWVQRHFMSQSQGGIMKAIRSDVLRTTPLPLPPLEEQTQIAAVLDSCIKVEKTAENEASSLNNLKRGLMQDLLTGRVRVQPD